MEIVYLPLVHRVLVDFVALIWGRIVAPGVDFVGTTLQSDGRRPTKTPAFCTGNRYSMCVFFCFLSLVSWRRANIGECMGQIDFDGFPVNIEINELYLPHM